MMDRKSFWTAVALAASMGLVAAATAETRETPAAVEAFAGVWLLDSEASDSISPLLELMDAPWIVTKMADTMVPTLTISVLGDGSLKMLNENAIRSSERQIYPDGKPHEQRDARGRRVVATGSWNQSGQLVMAQDNHLSSDRVVHVDSIWARTEDRLELVTRAETEDGPIQVRRIFRPKP